MGSIQPEPFGHCGRIIVLLIDQVPPDEIASCIPLILYRAQLDAMGVMPDSVVLDYTVCGIGYPYARFCASDQSVVFAEIVFDNHLLALILNVYASITVMVTVVVVDVYFPRGMGRNTLPAVIDLIVADSDAYIVPVRLVCVSS